MATTVTKEKYGKDYRDQRDVYRIRVLTDKEMKDFHLQVAIDRNHITGENHVIGNTPHQITILKPTSKGLTYGHFKPRKFPSRKWNNNHEGWEAPKINIPNSDRNTVYISFKRINCENSVNELIFDLAVNSFNRIKKWWITDDCNNTNYTPTDSNSIANGESIPDFDNVSYNNELNEAILMLKNIKNQFGSVILNDALSDVYLSSGYLFEIIDSENSSDYYEEEFFEG